MMMNHSTFFLLKKHCWVVIFLAGFFSCQSSSEYQSDLEQQDQAFKNIYSCLVEKHGLDSMKAKSEMPGAMRDSLGYLVTIYAVDADNCFFFELPKFHYLHNLYVNKLNAKDISKLTVLNLRILVLDNVIGDSLFIPDNWESLAYLRIESSNIKQIIFPKKNKLREVYLEDTKITSLDSSIQYLQELRLLSLLGTQVKDIDLASLPKLRYINMLATAANEEEIEAIRKKHPGILIDWY